MSVQDTNYGCDVPNCQASAIEPRLADSAISSLEVAMTRRSYELYGALFILASGVSCVDVSSAQARPEQEQVTVESPYTIRQQVLNRPMFREMQQTRISVDQQVSFADLDFKRPGDITTMRERIRDAARDSCQELDRRFPRSIFVPVNELNRLNCVRQATSQAFAQLDEVLMPTVR